MGSRSKFGCWILILTLTGSLTAGAESPEEKALTQLWDQHQKDPNQHQAIADGCAQFEKSFPQSALIAVPRGLAAWHLLKLRKTEPATAILNAMLSANSDVFSKAGNVIAQRWLSRLDREKVKTALKAVYNKRIEYPASLDALQSLPAPQKPPMTDRLGKPWTYSLQQFKQFTAVSAQAYSLQSPTLGATSDIADALKIPYGDTLKLKPTRVMSPGGGGQSAIVEFETTGPNPQKSVLSEFVKAGEKMFILANGDYWLIVPRPGG